MPYAFEKKKNQYFHDKSKLYDRYGIEIPDPILPPKKLVLLKGYLSDFKGIVCSVPLIDTGYMTEEQKRQRKRKLQTGAATAMLSGNSIAGLAALGHADDGNNQDDYLSALYITAQLNNNIQLKGWIGYFKFNDGDQVEVVAEKHSDHYEVYAIMRPIDQVISIIPPCSGGRIHTFKIIMFSYLLLTSFFSFLLIYISSTTQWRDIFIFILICLSVFGIASFFLFKLFKKTHTLLAERIFSTFGWQDVEYIDLWAMTKKKINRQIRQGKLSLADWDDDRDIGTRLSNNSSQNAPGVFYYDSKVVYKTKSSQNK